MSRGGDYRIHTRIAKNSGYERACKGKIRYQSEKQSVRAANNHNYAYEEYDHAVQNYPCPFCLGWHIGYTCNEPIENRNKIYKGDPRC